MKKNIFLILSLTTIIFCLISQVSLHGSHHHGKKKAKTDSKSPLKNLIQNQANSIKNSNTHNHEHNHDHSIIELYFSHYIHTLSEFLQTKLIQYTKKEQAYLSVMIVSSAAVPIFLIILLFNIKNIRILNGMTAFASGALLGDVLLHNLPEILKEDDENDSESFFKKKEIYICFGVIFLFAIEKIISLLTQQKEKKILEKKSEISVNHCDSHGHGHHGDKGNTQAIIISIIGDFVHNITDGLAIGAAFETSILVIYLF